MRGTGHTTGLGTATTLLFYTPLYTITMSLMPMQRGSWGILALLFIALCLVSSANAFGAGNIPGYSYLEGKAFRHGDIDDTIAQLAKKTGGMLGRGAKFGGLDIKRIYMGSWLADMSQAMDIGALEKLSKQNILNIIMVMGFMAFGYATQEFEITLDRLGAYLPVEHIDNPKGYGEGKDPRQVDPRLRGPINPQELEVDPRTGMKNYIANESGSWDTSSALVRRRLVECIELGRRARSNGDEKTLFEAYRLLGRCLHTLEDFPAHSNFCELALLKHGHNNVFSHVGDAVKVRAPDGKMVPPLVTGTFGGADFIHSLLGEAQDHLSSASISDVQKAVRNASSQGSSPMRDLIGLLGNVPGASSNLSRDAEELSRGPGQDPATMDPQELYRNLYRILSFRDSVMMSIERTIEKIPGLSSLVEKVSNSVSVFVFTLLEPYIQPVIKSALSGLQLSSSQVINQEDQFEVFNNAQASDPTHSILSKDHFGLVLNEVAGNLACIIVKHCVTLIVKAWDDPKQDPRSTADECLAPLFHPFWVDGNRCHPVQSQMLGFVSEWARNNPREVSKLDREHVRTHTNTRSGKAEPHNHGNSQYGVQVEGQQGLSMGTGMAHHVQSYVGGKISQSMGAGSGGGLFREGPDQSSRQDQGTYQHDARHTPSSYPSSNTPYESQGSMAMPSHNNESGFASDSHTPHFQPPSGPPPHGNPYPSGGSYPGGPPSNSQYANSSQYPGAPPGNSQYFGQSPYPGGQSQYPGGQPQYQGGQLQYPPGQSQYPGGPQNNGQYNPYGPPPGPPYY